MAGNKPTPLAGHNLGADGRLHRLGARVLLVDDADPAAVRLLMVLGHDPHQPERSFWFTPGGGIEAGESPREAAVRELAEETGYVLEVDELVGPVWLRTAVFDFASLPYTQTEEVFVGRLADAERRPTTDAVWTADEIEAIDDVAWMTREQLSADGREVFPAVLLESWDEFLDWNGQTRQMGRVDE